ncbi:hypothetical protein LX36DRAFT_669161 [Colletotrichum falcatum]|nr:hypothetical protein LX36DRAFT_669161 [Colletotrichum falcatum]
MFQGHGVRTRRPVVTHQPVHGTAFRERRRWCSLLAQSLVDVSHGNGGRSLDLPPLPLHPAPVRMIRKVEFESCPMTQNESDATSGSSRRHWARFFFSLFVQLWPKANYYVCSHHSPYLKKRIFLEGRSSIPNGSDWVGKFWAPSKIKLWGERDAGTPLARARAKHYTYCTAVAF